LSHKNQSPCTYKLKTHKFSIPIVWTYLQHVLLSRIFFSENIFKILIFNKLFPDTRSMKNKEIEFFPIFIFISWQNQNKWMKILLENSFIQFLFFFSFFFKCSAVSKNIFTHSVYFSFLNFSFSYSFSCFFF